MSRLIGLQLTLALVSACVPNRPIDDGQPCPCAPGWTCDETQQICVRDVVGEGACSPAAAPARLPVPRYLLAAAVAGDGRIFLVGGMSQTDSPSQPVRALTVYDPATNSYRDLSPPPTSYVGASAVVVGGVLLVNDGEVSRYDIASDTWTAAAPAPVHLIRRAAVAVGGRAYFFGGYRDDFQMVSSADAYDVAADSWAPLPDLPFIGASLGAAHGNGRTYVVSQLAVALDDGASSWTDLPSPLTGRFGLGAAVDRNGRLLTFGGSLTDTAGFSGDPEIYDPETDAWTMGVPLPEAVEGMGTAEGCDGAAVFALGGDAMDIGVTDRVQRYLFATDTWTSSD
jgi:N-acetylneuraminic acid mutarotase